MKSILICLAVACCFNEKTFSSAMEYDFGNEGFGFPCEQNKCSWCKRLASRSQTSKLVCIGLEFKIAEETLDVNFTLAGMLIFDKKVQGEHPKPLCAIVPLFENPVHTRVCIYLHNIKMDLEGIQGCVTLIAFAAVRQPFPIGCFKIPTALLQDKADILVFRRRIGIGN
ncbi:uncharacterized protein LOC133172234 [Saccostrea echinata]|uniref:uncharacterized protein LOC133172234 n=1 Tax=Saccostrea echinata TaxID=191078 RepID=UPI002A8015A3|nr:uncharacterized protein LOC133172234 [Saccostrea echinata]